MPKKKPTSLTLEALRRACRDERLAVEFIEARRWKGEAWCVYCMGKDVYAMKDRATGLRNKDYRWRCRTCNKQFTVRTATLMEKTGLPLKVWCYALWRMAASKKGISALQLSRECEITHKSALFLLHRLRFGVHQPEKPGPLTGTIEVDETYVGGKPRNRRFNKQGPRGNKAVVFGMLERGGELRLRHPSRATVKEIDGQLRANVSDEARLITDEAMVYRKIGRRFAGGHYRVNHTKREWAYGEITTNTIESVFAILKRQIYGTHHSISKEHMAMYLAEVQFKWNTNKLDDGERAVRALEACEGKRLMYCNHVVRKKKSG